MAPVAALYLCHIMFINLVQLTNPFFIPAFFSASVHFLPIQTNIPLLPQSRIKQSYNDINWLINESGYFFCRNRPSVHTKPVNPHIETAYFWNHPPECFFFWTDGFGEFVWTSETRYVFEVNYVKNLGPVLSGNSNWWTMLCCSDKLRNVR